MSYIFPARYYYGLTFTGWRPVILRRFRTAKLRDHWVAGAINRHICDGHAVEVRRARLDPAGWVDDSYLL